MSLPAKDNSIDHHIDPAIGGPVTGPAARIAPRPQPEGDPASFVVMGWGGPGGITPYGLARRSLGSQVLWLFGVSASAPMTVLAGGTVATFAATGVIAVPLSFPLLAVALGLFAIGYTRLARDVPHAATFAALLTHGLGRTVGAAAAFVAVLSYNCVQIGLYGLLGATLAGQLGGPWWGWALAAWTVVAVIGYRGVTLGAPVVAVVLTLELGMIVLFESWRSPIPRRPKPVRGCSPGAPTCSPSTGWAGCSPSASRRSSGSRPPRRSGRRCAPTARSAALRACAWRSSGSSTGSRRGRWPSPSAPTTSSTPPATRARGSPCAPGAGPGAAHTRVGHHPGRGYRPHRPGRRAQRARGDAPTAAPRRTRVVARLTLSVKQGSR